MNERTHEKLRSILGECAEDLFENQGAPLTRGDVGSMQDGVTLAASIGYTGTDVRGSLTLMTSLELVAASRPIELRGHPHTDAELADWIGELANQMLGRVKNRLFRFGVTMFMSTPVVLIGKRLRQKSASTLTLVEVAFEHNRQGLQVCLEVDGILELGSEAVDGPTAIAEGDFELF
jgi:CheY-specific phosphatase CheX